MTSVYKTYQQLEDEDHERYRKKQADILTRRKARIQAEGFKCTVEGCGESFKDTFLLRSHVNEHNEEMRKSMKCNQVKCKGLQFSNRRDYNDHMDKHKEEAKAKFINSIRSVLLFNKHGLLLEAFEREFRGMTGKQIPYQMLGFSSPYDLVTNLPDVVQVTHLAGGQTLLLAVPDKATEHIAKMVGNQRTNREGFNYRTGEVLASVSRDTIRKIEKTVEVRSREVPQFMKKQVEQLLQLEMFEEGLDIQEFREVYDKEFGYPLEFQCYGFYSIEDFVFHGLDGVVGLQLDGFTWRIVSANFDVLAKASTMEEIPIDVKDSIEKLLDENPYGVSTTTFAKIYEESFGKLNLRQLRCKDVVEVCLFTHSVCEVAGSACGDCAVLPVGHGVEMDSKDDGTLSPLWVLGEVKNNVRKMLQSLSFGVSIQAFTKGYEGYYGQMNLEQLKCKDVMELVRLMPDVCEVNVDENGQQLVRQVKLAGYNDEGGGEGDEEREIPSRLLLNLKRVLHSPRGVTLSKFCSKYLETVGENLNYKDMGFSNLRSLLRYLNGRFLKVSLLAKDPVIKLLENCVENDPGFVTPLGMETVAQAGWVRVVKVVSPGLMFLQMEGMIDEVMAMEDRMDKFYSKEMMDHKIKSEMLHAGLDVAVLSIDFSWHRGRVLAIREERNTAEVFFVDSGQRAEINMDTMRCLGKQFRDLPMQAVSVRLSGVQMLSDDRFWARKGLEVLEYIFGRTGDSVWMQKRTSPGDDFEVDLFMEISDSNVLKSEPSNMTLINQMLVDKGLVEMISDKRVGLLDMSLREEAVHVVDEFDRILQRLILARLVRIGREVYRL